MEELPASEGRSTEKQCRKWMDWRPSCEAKKARLRKTNSTFSLICGIHRAGTGT
jgi:hypothetical protein